MKRSPITPNLSRLTDEQLRRNSTLKPIAREVQWQRSPIKPVSEKRKVENRERSKVLTKLKARYPLCQRCGVRPSAEGHEPLTRARGGSIVDESNIVMLCNFPDGGCHRWIHDNPAEATKEGFLKSRWS